MRFGRAVGGGGRLGRHAQLQAGSRNPYATSAQSRKRGPRLGSEKRCRVCGDELECHDYGGGSVWTCGTHGVRDWVFAGQGGHAALRAPAAALAERAPRGPRAP